MYKTWFYVGLGIIAGMAINNQIASVLDPVLANVKLSVSLTA